MSLDLAHVNAQLDPLLQRRAPAGKDHQEALLRLQQGLTMVPCPTPPDEYVTLATDGSQIELDRHAPLQCYLINVGEVTLRYGPASHAALSSAPRLAAEDASASPQEPVDDDSAETAGRIHIDLERSVAELEGLLKLTKATPDDAPALALQDGSLMLWIYSYQSDTELYVKQYVDYLDQLRLLAQARTLAVASYASAPRSREYLEKVVGYPKTERELLDRDVFSVLPEGGRSEVFKSQRQLMKDYQPTENQIWYFYVNTGWEIGRVEVPAWVRCNPDLLDFTHAAVVDQCRRNFGYPVALMEAHQQAVVTEADRQAFWQLVSRRMEAQGLPVAHSAKSVSKRVPYS